MHVLPRTASDTMILDVVRQWVSFVAADQVDAAEALLHCDRDSPAWSPDLLRELVATYESPQALAEPPSVLIGAPSGTTQVAAVLPRSRVDRWEETDDSGIIGSVEFDLPPNRVCSDLTALFWIKSHPEGIVLELHDIQVL